jgi:HEAT repeat protein
MAEDGSGRWRDGLVLMKTRFDPADESWDTRSITMSEGRAVAESATATRGVRRGEVPPEAWEDLWKKLLKALDDEELKVTSEVANARGPYHMVELTLGDRKRVFSSQLRRNLLGIFSSPDVAEGLEYTDAIAEAVSRFATTQVAPPRDTSIKKPK